MAEEEKKAEEEEISEAEEEKLPFPTATVVREMKRHIEGSKMIRKEVKIGMNKFLGAIVKDVAEKMNKYPYATLDYRMFQEAIKPYTLVSELQAEKKRLIAHLDAITQDCASIKRDMESKFSEEVA